VRAQWLTCWYSVRPVASQSHAFNMQWLKLLVSFQAKCVIQVRRKKTDLIKALSESAVPLPGILSQVFRDTASSSWPATGRFGRYGLQGLSAAAGAGCFAPESGSFAYWLPDHAEGPCAVCLLVSRVDATRVDWQMQFFRWCVNSRSMGGFRIPVWEHR